jgi:isopentenyl-diphosphate delta-isomerase
VHTSTQFLGHTLSAPLLISCMTGGTEKAARINRRLARAAQAHGIAMGLGSQRAAIEEESLAASFQVRDYAPEILLLANLGAVQLNYGYDVNTCQRAVEMVGADALVLHLNALQEALQPKGDTHFGGLLAKIEQVCTKLPVPVIAKEVGWGISAADATRLVNAGVAAIDIAGAGGTSWSQVEMHRAEDEKAARLASSFIDWGIPTAEALVAARRALPETPLVASGGLRDGIDVAKCVSLGADLCGIAGPFLRAAAHSAEAIVDSVDEFVSTLRICMFAVGSADIKSLAKTHLVERP